MDGSCRTRTGEANDAFSRVGSRAIADCRTRFSLFLSRLSTCSSEPPFDRHDWIVRRPSDDSEHRYIIDYYSAPPDEDGSPNFHLDVRPALDDLDGVRARWSAFIDDFRSDKAEQAKRDW